MSPARRSTSAITTRPKTASRAEPDASLIVTGPGRVAVAYTRIDSDPEYGDVERVFVNVPHLARGRASR